MGRLARPGLTVLALALLAQLPSGCISIVEVRTADKPPALSLWPFGVKVDRGENDAVAVDQASFGLGLGCMGAWLGFGRESCSVIDPNSCGVAVVRPDKNTDENILADVSAATVAECLKPQERKP